MIFTIQQPPRQHRLTLLECESRNHQLIWRVHPYQDRSGDRHDHFILRCYCIDFDGLSYGPVLRDFRVDHYEGERDITALPFYPLRFASDATRIIEQSTKRGKYFQRYVAQKQLAYKVWAPFSIGTKGTDNVEQGYVSSNVIIDFSEAFKVHPKWKVQLSILRDGESGYWRKDHDDRREWMYGSISKCMLWDTYENYIIIGSPSYIHILMKRRRRRSHSFLTMKNKEKATRNVNKLENEPLQTKDLVLLPRRLFAYALQDRKFVMVDIDHLKPLKDTGDAFANLIIDPRHRSMVSSLIYVHIEKKEIEEAHGFHSANQDIIQSKGRGLVVLLHRVPRVDKSSTAESVARN